MKCYLLLPILLLAACSREAPKLERKAIGTAVKNLQVVADDVGKTDEPVSRIIDNQANLIYFSMNYTEDEWKDITASVSPVGLSDNPILEADKSDQDTEVTMAQITAARERDANSWWSWITSATFWTTAGGIGLFLVRVLGPSFGIPTNLVVDPLVRMLPGAKGLMQKAESTNHRVSVLSKTVEGSMVGRYALNLIDSKLSSKNKAEIAEYVSKLTRGKYSTIEGLFKHFAAGHVVDSQADPMEIKTAVAEAKNRIKTVNGVPESLKNL